MQSMTVDDALVTRAEVALGVSPIKELQSGAQKRVFLVESDGNEVVLKVVGLTSSTPDALRRAQREVDLLAGLADPNLVKVRSELVELGTPPDGVAWLEEFVPGEDLRARIGPPWEWSDACQLGKDLANGLAAMHRSGGVHEI